MYKILFEIEAYVLAIVLAIIVGTVVCTVFAYMLFGWAGVPVPTAIVAIALWARARYLR